MATRRVRTMLIAVLASLYLLPALLALVVHAATHDHALRHWQARTDATGLAPDPAAAPEAVVQVYAARAFGWRGVLGVHTWIAVKPAQAAAYTRYEVFGWGVRHGREALRVRTGLAPDGYWFGSRPTLLADLRGPAAGRIIARIHDAAQRYPHNHEYRVWPGPNSNTFLAFIGREVPELRLKLPATAIGKDFIAGGGILARSPSGTGVQLSLFGLVGVLAALDEGLEINLLGLTAGIDLLRPALKLPGIGRIGVGD